LDTCTEEHGPLEILPGTHRAGILSPERIADAAREPAMTITMAAGSLLMLHPLLLHRSRPARKLAHRRVLHLEWCDVPLPAGAAWLDGAA
jgi:ectoine hydroxylase-related dioxygenase (phytanoyl-CoA dioxygenase family)